MSRLNSVRDVAERHLCCGCGACAYLEPEAVRMVDDFEVGLRPMVTDGAGVESLAVCPGIELEHPETPPAGALPELQQGWGPVLEVWEGFARDDEIRYQGSSGGVATALSIFGIEEERMGGVLHIRARPDSPFQNETVLSTTREEVVAAVGSRYAPASPCDGLARIEEAASPCVFVGKPCDVAGAQRARRLRPALDEKLGVTIAIFCAGTPSTKGTLAMLEAMGFEDPTKVSAVRYRGHGWPGRAEAKDLEGEAGPSLSYDESWGKILQKHRQWRCRLCIDHTGEFADISVGDPWYREIPPGEPGRSLVVVRSQRGRDFLARARAAGAVDLEQVDPALLPASQPNLLQTRGSAWGRLFAMALLGLPRPRYVRLPSWPFWLRLSLRAKAQSILGTLRRLLQRGLHRPRPVQEDPVQEGEGPG